MSTVVVLPLLAGLLGMGSAWRPHAIPDAPPLVDYVVLDPSNDWRETNNFVEGLPYAFNASRTTDDSLLHPWDNANLTYRWDFGDGTVLGPGKGGAPDFLLNVTHAYARWGSDYGFNLTVTDATNESAWLRRMVVVQADVTAHADLSIVPGTLAVSPPSPEEGETVRFRVNVTNARGRATASHLRVRLTIVELGQETNQSIRHIRFLDSLGNDFVGLPAGQNATVEFSWTALDRSGNLSLRVHVWDEEEPSPWINAANQQALRLTVTAPFSRWSAAGAVALGATTAAVVAALLTGLRRLDRKKPPGRSV